MRYGRSIGMTTAPLILRNMIGNMLIVAFPSVTWWFPLGSKKPRTILVVRGFLFHSAWQRALLHSCLGTLGSWD